MQVSFGVIRNIQDFHYTFHQDTSSLVVEYVQYHHEQLSEEGCHHSGDWGRRGKEVTVPSATV